MKSKALLQSIIEDSHQSADIDWFNGEEKTSSEILAYIAGGPLRQQGLYLDSLEALTEAEARREIQKYRKTVIPLLLHFIEVELKILGEQNAAQ